MRIAIAYDNGQIFQHFGRTPAFKVYDIEDGQITDTQIISAEGFGHGALAGFLQAAGVTTLVCGGIGHGAQMALADMGLNLYAGVIGDADEAAKALAEGRLQQNTDATCDHHEHGEGHDCGHGEGGCGHHGGGCHQN